MWCVVYGIYPTLMDQALSMIAGYMKKLMIHVEEDQVALSATKNPGPQYVVVEEGVVADRAAKTRNILIKHHRLFLFCASP